MNEPTTQSTPHAIALSTIAAGCISLAMGGLASQLEPAGGAYFEGLLTLTLSGVAFTLGAGLFLAENHGNEFRIVVRVAGCRPYFLTVGALLWITAAPVAVAVNLAHISPDATAGAGLGVATALSSLTLTLGLAVTFGLFSATRPDRLTRAVRAHPHAFHVSRRIRPRAVPADPAPAPDDDTTLVELHARLRVLTTEARNGGDPTEYGSWLGALLATTHPDDRFDRVVGEVLRTLDRRDFALAALDALPAAAVDAAGSDHAARKARVKAFQLTRHLYNDPWPSSRMFVPLLEAHTTLDSISSGSMHWLIAESTRRSVPRDVASEVRTWTHAHIEGLIGRRDSPEARDELLARLIRTVAKFQSQLPEDERSEAQTGRLLLNAKYEGPDFPKAAAAREEHPFPWDTVGDLAGDANAGQAENTPTHPTAEPSPADPPETAASPTPSRTRTRVRAGRPRRNPDV